MEKIQPSEIVWESEPPCYNFLQCIGEQCSEPKVCREATD